MVCFGFAFCFCLLVFGGVGGCDDVSDTDIYKSLIKMAKCVIE